MPVEALRILEIGGMADIGDLGEPGIRHQRLYRADAIRRIEDVVGPHYVEDGHARRRERRRVHPLEIAGHRTEAVGIEARERGIEDRLLGEPLARLRAEHADHLWQTGGAL